MSRRRARARPTRANVASSGRADRRWRRRPYSPPLRSSAPFFAAFARRAGSRARGPSSARAPKKRSGSKAVASHRSAMRRFVGVAAPRARAPAAPPRATRHTPSLDALGGRWPPTGAPSRRFGQDAAQRRLAEQRRLARPARRSARAPRRRASAQRQHASGDVEPRGDWRASAPIYGVRRVRARARARRTTARTRVASAHACPRRLRRPATRSRTRAAAVCPIGDRAADPRLATSSNLLSRGRNPLITGRGGVRRRRLFSATGCVFGTLGGAATHRF